MRTVLALWAVAMSVLPALGGTYTNPIISADIPDPDVIRVGTDYYMTSSSFNLTPGLPVYHSEDLVHWTMIGHALERNPPALYTFQGRTADQLDYDRVRLGLGVYAPSIRHHDGHFWIYWADPDAGVYMVKARNPAGPWSEPVLVHKAHGWIDPSPLWDEATGKAYLTYAFAKSRVGVNGLINVSEMSWDGTRLIGEPVTVFAVGRREFPSDRVHTTIEGPKFMKLGDFYYILCPAGGVRFGWQTVLRAKHPMGPYEIRTVCETGRTNVNGPHQGGLVDTPDGRWWFIHFQDVGTLGRIIWLQPVVWNNDWPVIGVDANGDGIGNPVRQYEAPLPFVKKAIQTSDDFLGDQPGLPWQWAANPQEGWARVEKGELIMPAQWTGRKPLVEVPGVLSQVFPGYRFSATVNMKLEGTDADVRAGLVVLGTKSFDIGVQPAGETQRLSVRYQLTELASAVVPAGRLWLRLDTDGELPLPLKPRSLARAGPAEPYQVEDRSPFNGQITGQFSYSLDGVEFVEIGPGFEARPGRWIGARVGLFSIKEHAESSGTLRADRFEVSIQGADE
jgi:beta-xylosidase